MDSPMTVIVGGARPAYRRTGGGQPLVLLHAGLSDARSGENVEEAPEVVARAVTAVGRELTLGDEGCGS
jgi:pimeloyl-ACP methyl ester carboxylesterase